MDQSEKGNERYEISISRQSKIFYGCKGGNLIRKYERLRRRTLREGIEKYVDRKDTGSSKTYLYSGGVFSEGTSGLTLRTNKVIIVSPYTLIQ